MSVAHRSYGGAPSLPASPLRYSSASRRSVPTVRHSQTGMPYAEPMTAVSRAVAAEPATPANSRVYSTLSLSARMSATQVEAVPKCGEVAGQDPSEAREMDTMADEARGRLSLRPVLLLVLSWRARKQVTESGELKMSATAARLCWEEGGGWKEARGLVGETRRQRVLMECDGVWAQE